MCDFLADVRVLTYKVDVYLTAYFDLPKRKIALEPQESHYPFKIFAKSFIFGEKQLCTVFWTFCK